MKKNSSLKKKIILPCILLFAIYGLFLFFYNFYQFNSYVQNVTKNQIRQTIKEFQEQIHNMEKELISISTLCAEMSWVKDIYMEYYQTKEISASHKRLFDEFQSIQKGFVRNIGQECRIHFHLPPAVSLCRIWSSKHGDDLSSFRKTVMAVMEKKKPISGIEVGRGGFVIRGLSPILQQNKILGSVECYYDIFELIKRVKVQETEDFAIYMNENLLSIATDFDKSVASNIDKNQQRIASNIFVAKTSENFRYDLLKKEFFQNMNNELITYQTDNYLFTLFPIYDYQKEIIGTGIYQINNRESRDYKNRLIFFQIIASIILFTFVFILLTIIIRYYTNPIQELKKSADLLAQGYLDIQFPKFQQDEIGSIGHALINLDDKWKDIIGKTQSSISVIDNGSGEIKASSEEISQSAQNEVRKTEEVLQSIKKINELTEQGMIQANNTRKMIKNGESEINKNQVIIQNTKEKMEQVKKSGAEINSIVDLVREIAFQTNILSLNASVEAARAGESGKGFAVVAAEVRSLAQRSSNFSGDIKKQIDDINQKLEEESDLILKTSIFFEEIKNIFNKINKMISEIEESSNLQVSAGKNIEVSINEINQDVEKRAALSEELSATSSSLKQQIEELEKAIQYFKLKKDKT